MRRDSTAGRLLPACLAALLLAALPAAARAASPERLETCLAANAPRASSRLAMRLVSRHRDGSAFEHRGHVLWKGAAEGPSDTLVCMSEPAEIRGLAYLIHEEGDKRSVWGYLPEQQRVMQIHASAAARRARIARTAVSYDDLAYLPVNLGGVEPGPVSADTLAGRPVSVARLALPPGDATPYARIVASVDDESCVPLQIRFFDVNEKVVKRVTADPASLGSAGSVQLARTLRVEDLKHGIETVFIVESIEVDGEVPDETFSRRRLERGRCP